MDLPAVTFDLWNTLLWDQTYTQMPEFLAGGMGDILAAEGIFIDKEKLAAVVSDCRDLVMSRQVDEGLEFIPEEQLAWILGRMDMRIPGWLANKLLNYYTTVRPGGRVNVMKGARDVLEELSKKYPLAVICNTGRTPGRVVRGLLSATDISCYLQVLTFSDEERIAKPNPDIFIRTLKKMGAETRGSAHIGDDPRTDLKGAYSVGMYPIWFNAKKKNGCPEWAYEIHCLEELPVLLDILFGQNGDRRL